MTRIVGRPAERVRLSMRVLANTSQEFGVFMDWLRQVREDSVKTLSVSRDQWTAAQMQGVVQTLDGVLESIEDSRR